MISLAGIKTESKDMTRMVIFAKTASWITTDIGSVGQHVLLRISQSTTTLKRSVWRNVDLPVNKKMMYKKKMSKKMMSKKKMK